MKFEAKVNTKDLEAALSAVKFGEGDGLEVEGAGARVQINGQRMRVPVDTADTQNSVGSHITEASKERIVDEIGPETLYAPNIEFGIQDKPNYPIQPFVRPTAINDFEKTIRAIGHAFGALVIARWPR